MKNTLLIFGLLWALGASGQIYIDSYRFGAAPAANLLLDDYPNAAAAYSLRLLRTAYTGDCVEVRRSSDNTTSNIGFSGNYLDTAALKTFCASTDCFVQTWYDQSTTVNNLVQAETTRQPQIISGGNLIYNTGSPVVRYTLGRFLVQSNNWGISGTNPHTLIFAHYPTNNNSTNNYIISLASNYSMLVFQYLLNVNPGQMRWASAATINTAHLTILDYPSGTNITDYDLYDNSLTISPSLQTAGTISITDQPMRLGVHPSILGRTYEGDFWEVIIYNSSQSSNRTGIESNINSFYNIY